MESRLIKFENVSFRLLIEYCAGDEESKTRDIIFGVLDIILIVFGAWSKKFGTCLYLLTWGIAMYVSNT